MTSIADLTTKKERIELIEIVKRNCGCRMDCNGELAFACEVHKTLAENDNWVRHLIFVRRTLSKQMIDEEFKPVTIRSH